jgi:hypothetical protein
LLCLTLDTASRQRICERDPQQRLFCTGSDGALVVCPTFSSNAHVCDDVAAARREETPLMELFGILFVILFLVGFFRSSDASGGHATHDDDDDGPWDETDPMFYHMHDEVNDY